jgi:hypothetical protein
MKKICLVITVVLLMVTLPVCGCGSTTKYHAKPQTISPGNYISFPPNGIYIPVNGPKTLELSCSVGGMVDCYILTEDQYKSLQNSPWGIVSSSMSMGRGLSGTISAVIQNSGTYYAVIQNSTLYESSPVKLYEATLTVK